jgi:hypothetical protein
VFKATGASAVELFSARTDGRAPPVKLNGPLVPGGDVTYPGSLGGVSGVYLLPRISADGRRVVYLADADTNGVNELYAVPIDGSGPAVAVCGPFPSGGDALTTNGRPAFALTPDGSGVVYIGDQEQDGRHELFVSELPPLP